MPGPEDRVGVAEALARSEAAIRGGDFPAAAASLEAARRAAPGDLNVLHALAGVRHALGEHDAAAGLLEEAIARAPSEPRLWHSLGLIRHGAGRYRAALQAYERALALAPDWADALAARGKIRQLMNDLEGAEADFRAALAARPGHPDAVGGLAAGLELRGRAAEALALLDPLVEAGAAPPALAIAWARLNLDGEGAGRAEALLRQMLDGPIAEVERSHALFALADLLDRRDACDEAFACYAEANRLKPGAFDPAAWAEEVDGILAAWSRETLAALSPGSESERPLFIVGMPRSGTTLVEQILSAHPSVHGGGELEALATVARSLGRPPRPGRLGADGAAALAARYLELAGGPSAAARVTDKMPANFRHLGLIQVLFPRARIVHCRRDPRDVALSCFRQDFSALGLDWSRELDSIGAYYAGYRRLMDHWSGLLGEQLIELDYETLVADPEAGARRLVAHAGLDWDPACGHAHRSGRVAPTASHEQVRRPVYTDAVGRHRRYAAALAPLARWLGSSGE